MRGKLCRHISRGKKTDKVFITNVSPVELDNWEIILCDAPPTPRPAEMRGNTVAISVGERRLTKFSSQTSVLLSLIIGRSSSATLPPPHLLNFVKFEHHATCKGRRTCEANSVATSVGERRLTKFSSQTSVLLSLIIGRSSSATLPYPNCSTSSSSNTTQHVKAGGHAWQHCRDISRGKKTDKVFITNVSPVELDNWEIILCDTPPTPTAQLRQVRTPRNM